MKRANLGAMAATMLLFLGLCLYSFSQFYAHVKARSAYQVDFDKVKKESREGLSRALWARPWDGVLWKKLADMDYYLGKRDSRALTRAWRRAEKEYIHALHSAPAHTLTPWALSTMVYEKKPRSTAWEFFFDAAHSLYPMNKTLAVEGSTRFFQRAAQDARLGRHAEAGRSFQHGLKLSYRPFWRFLALASLEAAQERWETAWGIFRQAEEALFQDRHRSYYLSEKAWGREFWLRFGDDAVRRKQWAHAREAFNFAGRNDMYVGAFLRSLHNVYASDEEDIWGGPPFVAYEDFEYGSAMAYAGGYPGDLLPETKLRSPGFQSRQCLELRFEAPGIQYGHASLPINAVLFSDDHVTLKAKLRFIHPKKNTKGFVFLAWRDAYPARRSMLFRTANATQKSVEDETWKTYVTGDVFEGAVKEFQKRFPDQTLYQIKIKQAGVTAWNAEDFYVDDIRFYLGE